MGVNISCDGCKLWPDSKYQSMPPHSSMPQDHQNTLKSSELKKYITCIASR
jgi:hypothetical protein